MGRGICFYKRNSSTWQNPGQLFVAQVLKRFKKNLRNAGIDITENIHILSTNDHIV